MYKQLNHSNHEAAYLLGSILLFSFQGGKKKTVFSFIFRNSPNVIYVFQTKCVTMRWVSGERRDSGMR